ncbi:MAG TPA: hypothetical protein VF808_19765 [Ktedonobacterales bacterium]
MSRGLYRFYLYFVTISLAESIVVSLGALLYQLLQRTPLQGSGYYPGFGSPSDSTPLSQAVIQFTVTLVVAGAFLALHYWLIRRDSASDPVGARESGVRAFLLNWTEANATLTAVIAGVIAMWYVGQTYGSAAPATATALAALVLALALEWERRRLTPTRGAAQVFDRLRRHLVPYIILLSVVIYTLYNLANHLERLIGQQGLYTCNPINGQQYQLPTCVGSEINGALLSAAVAVGSWLWLLWLGSRDAQSQMRQVMLLLGWASGGMITLAYALQVAAEYILRRLTPNAGAPDYLNSSDFGPWLVVAFVTLAVYGWVLRARAGGAMGAQAVRLTMRALAAAVLAFPFWYGVYLVLLLYVTFLAQPGATSPTLASWDRPLSYLIAGVGYIPLAFWLGAGSRATEIRGPRRGFVLALLAAGALVTASAAVSLLYTLLTRALSVPLSGRLLTAETAGSSLLTGLALGGVYLFIALRERQFTGTPHIPAAAPAASAEAAEPAPAPASSLDEALRQLEAGAITRDAAAERIRDLARTGGLM